EVVVARPRDDEGREFALEEEGPVQRDLREAVDVRVDLAEAGLPAVDTREERLGGRAGPLVEERVVERDEANDLPRREAPEERREEEDDADAQDRAALLLGEPGGARLPGRVDLGVRRRHEPAPRSRRRPRSRKKKRIDASVRSRLCRRARRRSSGTGWKWERRPSSAGRYRTPTGRFERGIRAHAVRTAISTATSIRSLLTRSARIDSTG